MGWLASVVVVGAIVALVSGLIWSLVRASKRAERKRAERAENGLREAAGQAKRHARPLPDDDDMRGLGMPDA